MPSVGIKTTRRGLAPARNTVSSAVAVLRGCTLGHPSKANVSMRLGGHVWAGDLPLKGGLARGWARMRFLRKGGVPSPVMTGLGPRFGIWAGEG